MGDLWVVHHMLSTARPGFVWQFAGPCCDFFKVFQLLIEQRTCIHVAYECQDNSTGLGSEPFRFLEIGVGGGYIALRVLHRFPNMQYIGVDPMEHSVIGTHWSRHGHAWDVDWDVDMHFDVLARRVAAFGHGSMLLRMTSEMAAREWESTSCIDLVFIDGEHSFDAVFNDLTLWLPHVCSGGIIAGHDLTWGWG